MKKLLSLPPNVVGSFHTLTGLSREEYFCTNDPIGHKLGSGGGTAWLLNECVRSEGCAEDFSTWLAKEKRILIHAGGQSRRLPAYAPSGKALTPIPVLRWERGQRLSQDLLSLQLPLYEQIMRAAPDAMHTMVVSGDVLIRSTAPMVRVPEADVVCYGLWLGAETARNHGVFVSEQHTPNVLKQMLQKPTIEQLNDLQSDHYYLTDIGLWLLSDRAVEMLMKRCAEGQPYDLYSQFGGALGINPTLDDPEIRKLSVAIVPLNGGEFYHFGTSLEMITSTLRLMNLTDDQRRVLHRSRKPHPSIFIQNATTEVQLSNQNQYVWIENSHIGSGWTLSDHHVITGVPENDWQLQLKSGQCLDIVPIGERDWAVRTYEMASRFDGGEQQKKQFPVVSTIEEMGEVAKQMIERGRPDNQRLTLLSAEDLSNQANLQRLFDQRATFRKKNWPKIADNWRHSVFYQLDLDDAAKEFKQMGIAMPKPIGDDAPLTTRIHDAMFRGNDEKAFRLLRDGITSSIHSATPRPQMAVKRDQIVWARSPVRIDIAGGWTDTPPYCLLEGGRVVNIAIELNGQPPIQTYIRPSTTPCIILRSIDLGASETITTSAQLKDYQHVGSPFSIPKVALTLAGFGITDNLEEELRQFGCGIELTLLSAIPAGSGLGTSSMLAANVLGAINDFCGLGWDKTDLVRQTLVLEQQLTTGGGWQDQAGGVLQGVKMLETTPGFDQTPTVRWLPNDLYTQPEYRACHLLYYTGITRTAKTILAEIVRRMFLNESRQMILLRRMKAQATEMYEAIQKGDFQQMGRLVGKTWLQNQAIDSGTNPDEVRHLTQLIDDYCLGYKLPGAGGGGYLYMVAKDPEAAARIKQTLNEQRTNANARFVEMTLSTKGLQVSRS